MREYKFNVKPSDCRYIVNEEKRTVVCLIENTDCMFIHFADNNFDIPWNCMDGIWSRKPMNKLFRKKFLDQNVYYVQNDNYMNMILSILQQNLEKSKYSLLTLFHLKLFH